MIVESKNGKKYSVNEFFPHKKLKALIGNDFLSINKRERLIRLILSDEVTVRFYSENVAKDIAFDISGGVSEEYGLWEIVVI